MDLPSQRIERSEFAPLLRTASRAAKSASAFIRDRTGSRASLDWHEKRPADFVSEVDTGAEERIRAIIMSEHPDAVIVGEELSPATTANAGLTFFVDPLDGTTNFLHGYPQYAVSIGVQFGDQLVAGVVRNVVLDEEWCAVKGAGAYRNREPQRVSEIDAPSRSLIGTGFPFKHPELIEAYQRQFTDVMRQTSGVRRAGSAALDLADVAAGRFDAFWELRLAPWDTAAGILLVREAGGVVTDLRGNAAIARSGGVVAGNPRMHEWLLNIVREQ